MAPTDSDPDGSVIASLSVISPASIEGLEPYRRESAEGPHVYDLGTERFRESDAADRAERLDAAITGLLHRLDDVSSSTLHDPATFVRLFLTFGGGAHTLSSDALRRLAGVNATLWIDT